MPLQYPGGILQEHLHTRAAAGLFDLSHMGQIAVRARSGNALDAAHALEALLPLDLVGLPPGRQRYGLWTTAAGGIRDDVMIANLGDRWYLVVNAATLVADLALCQAQLAATCIIDHLTDRALLAIQGPLAAAALSEVLPSTADMRFMDAAVVQFEGAACYISRSGYTGEDGFEISVPEERAEALARRLLQNADVRLAGLGARDSLRLEAGLCLYGHDLDIHVTPVEAALEWTIPPARRATGARPAGFPGHEMILDQLAHGVARRRVGLRPQGRPVRAGATLFADARSTQPLGRVTSGTFGPSLQAPVAMGYVPVSLAAPGTPLYAEVAGQRVPVAVSGLPFVAHRYQR
jgi:aminomethyltransferase